MFDELTEAGALLQSALERYRAACSTVESYCRKHDLTVAASDRVCHELSLANAFTTTLEKAKLHITYSRNSSHHAVPIHSLPSEIFTHIINLAVELGHELCEKRHVDIPYCLSRIHQQPNIFASVCVRWRSLLLQCPTLWSRINLVHGDFPCPNLQFISRAKLWTGRAGSAPLDIHVSTGHYAGDPDDEEALIDAIMSMANYNLGSLSFFLYNLEADKEVTLLNRYFSNWEPGTLKTLAIEKYQAYLNFPNRVIKSASQQVPDSENEVLINIPHERLEALLKPITTLRLQGLYIDWRSQVYHGLVELCLFHGTSQRDIPGISKSQLASIFASSPGLQVLRFGIRIEDDIIQGPPTGRAIAPVQLDHLRILNLEPTKLYSRAERGLDSPRHILSMISPAPRPFELLLPHDFDTDLIVNRRELHGFAMRSKVTRLGLFIQKPIPDWLWSSVPYLQTLAIRMPVRDLKPPGQVSQEVLNSFVSLGTLNNLYVLESSVDLDILSRWLMIYPSIQRLVFWRCWFLSGGNRIFEYKLDEEPRWLELLDNCPEVKVIRTEPAPIFGWGMPRYDHPYSF